MEHDFSSEIFLSSLNSLIVTLENCDGNAWNQLMDDVAVLYESTSDPSDFIALASARCAVYASQHFWKAFPNRSMDCRLMLIAGASAAIACSFKEDLDLAKQADACSRLSL